MTATTPETPLPARLGGLPDLNETGLIGRTYDQAQARPRAGFFVESLGATLALVGSLATLLFRRR